MLSPCFGDPYLWIWWDKSWMVLKILAIQKEKIKNKKIKEFGFFFHCKIIWISAIPYVMFCLFTSCKLLTSAIPKNFISGDLIFQILLDLFSDSCASICWITPVFFPSHFHVQQEHCGVQLVEYPQFFFFLSTSICSKSSLMFWAVNYSWCAKLGLNHYANYGWWSFINHYANCGV